jgi:hypothetical protein
VYHRGLDLITEESIYERLRRVVLLPAVGLTACGVLEQFSPARRLAKAEEEVRAAKDDYRRLQPLGEAAMASVEVGDYEKAKRYADGRQPARAVSGGARAEGLVAFGCDDEEERAAFGRQVFVDAAGE